ncbi:nucleotide-sugar transporter [Trichosporon asahii var. asahii CBS 2479]|uniref:GDP-mannose transporter n=1 Tax=Trichosporon asahii var. asahii (strain ATCC 90039 / CBS 2479 / JCM 2466 / KCTC 7840 / NBRC 103889/ NCYC 2677 / UAMH 7654) TaxID=1186058 RepID=J6ERG1_TRIAS|nr:nucleotide-sugar transporter [Trichosporon asahii var. asahii CBS 2479]EJT45307.1 nucleotide-sugar transporter [Trichosporon asahii var. asahii CBS 2479]
MTSAASEAPPGYELAVSEEIFRASTSSDDSLRDNPAKPVNVKNGDSDSDDDDLVVHEHSGLQSAGSGSSPYQHQLGAASRTHLASVGEKKALFISSALIFVLFFAFLFHLEKYSLRLVLVIGMISFGVFLMVFNTTAVSLPGIIMVFTASALGGLRWALTELIMHKRAMGLSNPFATIFWLSPLMAVGLFFVSALAEDWAGMFRQFFHGIEALKNIGVIALPGFIAFGMVASEYFVLQRAGIVPLSVAGIFKEVSTISFSAWIFGDELTPINIVGVVVTVCGIALFSYHKYQKSISQTVEIDETGRAITHDGLDDERTPLAHGNYETEERSMRTGSTPASRPESVRLHTLAPSTDDDDEDRVNRMRDDFEGWDHPGSEDEYEPDDDLVEAMRENRGRSKWAEWWDKPM